MKKFALVIITLSILIAALLFFQDRTDSALFRRLQQERESLHHIEMAYLNRKLSPHTLEIARSAPVHGFVSTPFLNEIMAGFNGHRLTLPEFPELRFTIRSLRLDTRTTLPRVIMTVIVRHPESGLEVTMKGIGTLQSEFSPQPQPHMNLRIRLVDLLPEARWTRWRFRMRGFVRRLLTIKVKKLEQQLPPIRVPLAFHIPIRIPAHQMPLRIRLGEGLIEGILTFPAYAVQLHLQIADILYLPDGIHLLLNLESTDAGEKRQPVETESPPFPDSNLSSLRSAYLKRFAFLSVPDRDIFIALREPLLKQAFQTFDHLDSSRRTVTFDLARQKPPLVNQWKGALGCGFWVAIDRNELHALLTVNHLKGQNSNENAYLVQTDLNLVARGRTDALVRGPKCPFKSCRKCTLTSIRIKRPVRLIHKDTLTLRLTIQDATNGHFHFAVELARPKPLDLKFEIDLPVVGRKVFPVHLTLKPGTLYRGTLPGFFEQEGHLALELPGVSPFNRFYQVSLSQPNLNFKHGGLFLGAKLNVIWQSPPASVSNHTLSRNTPGR